MNLHRNDIGTLIKIDVGVDISLAKAVSILFERPDKTTGLWQAVLVEATVLGYLTQEGDLSQVGTWSVQPHVVLPNWKGSGMINNFTVLDNIETVLWGEVDEEALIVDDTPVQLDTVTDVSESSVIADEPI